MAQASSFLRRKPPFRVEIGHVLDEQCGEFLCVYYVIDADAMFLCEAVDKEAAVRIAHLCNVACEVENPEPEIMGDENHFVKEE